MFKKIAHAQICKVDEAKREVWGIATEEVPDCSGEIFDYTTSKPYFQKWSENASKITDGKSLGNLRYMHQLDAVGKLIAIDFDDEQKQIRIGTKIVDDSVWEKVVEGVLAGFSIGGSYVKTWKDKVSDFLRFTAKPSEISIVDLPCCPTATFEMVKADGTTATCQFKVVEKKGGILFHYGIKDGKSEVQSVLFSKDSWTKEEAKAWLKENGYSSGKSDESDNYYHFTQHDPGKYDSIRTGKPGDKSGDKALGGDMSKDSRLEIMALEMDQPESIKTAWGLLDSTEKKFQVQAAKSMYDVADLACLLVQIRNIMSYQKWEADMEDNDQDNYAIADALGKWLSDGVEILKDLVDEETSELTAA